MISSYLAIDLDEVTALAHMTDCSIMITFKSGIQQRTGAFCDKEEQLKVFKKAVFEWQNKPFNDSPIR